MRKRAIACHSALAGALVAATIGLGSAPALAQSSALPCPLSASYRAGNPFARIIRGELPVSMIDEDTRVMAIVPLEWEHPGHALIIPKAAVRNLNDLTDEDALAVLHMAKRVAAAQQRALGSTGYSLQQNNARQQDVCHLHVHVIPNTPAVARVHATRAEMDAMAARLRAALPQR